MERIIIFILVNGIGCIRLGREKIIMRVSILGLYDKII